MGQIFTLSILQLYMCGPNNGLNMSTKSNLPPCFSLLYAAFSIKNMPKNAKHLCILYIIKL